ncbi:hypothetical protein B7494_g166 [Chlorociboria aeruginascens]|nr:hypothetical protein B7494_g166 [Chlorociboria aeruginascens]
MAMASSPTPMGNHFGHRRPASQAAFRQPPSRPNLNRGEPLPATHTRQYSLNDSSDDEIPVPMKFSALTKALLNDDASVVDQSTSRTTKEPEPGQARAGSGSLSLLDGPAADPETRSNGPFPKRIVRLSGTPGSSTLRRTASLSSAVKRRNEQLAAKAESPLDLNTPAPMPRTVRIPITTSNNSGISAGSSGRLSIRTNSESRKEEEVGSQEHLTTVARSQLATSQGSVSKYGTVGRTRYGEEAGLQSSMRPKRLGKMAGSFLSGPARRGRRRQDDEDQSPVDEQGDVLDAAGSNQEPQSQESKALEPQSENPGSSQESETNRASLYSLSYRDFASGSPVGSKNIHNSISSRSPPKPRDSGSPPNSKEYLNSVLRSRSPPPPTLSNSKLATQDSQGSKIGQPVFKVPAPRPDIPSAHDQENEAPPTFKRNKQTSSILLDQMEKVPVRPESLDLGIMRAAISPERRPLASRSQNTPRRQAPPPPKMSVLEAATSTAGAATTSHANGKRNRLKVNGKAFTRLDVIGRGGSSKVYRVMAENSQIFALKRVSLDDADEMTVRGFKGEIDLLTKLKSVDRVITLFDYEVNDEKGVLSVLLEMGELDMKKIFDLRVTSETAKLDVSFVRHYWKEMLECLEAVHKHNVVHSDLKPQNFVLVKGRLKLIDFGIANAIQTDETVNVHRESQIGTPNYMSPESLVDLNAKPDSRGRIPNEPKLLKLGKPSDIWSLGCILYQMVYGKPPFAHVLNPMQRCQAIINFNYAIEYPSLGIGNVPVPKSLIRTLKACLNRDQHQRPTASELLSDKDTFLNPVEIEENAFPMTEELLGRILQNVAAKCKDRMPSDSELLTLWSAGYFASLRKSVKEGRAV